MEETIHISFKERRKDIDQKVQDLEEEMENLFLNNDANNQQILQIATTDENVDSEFPIHHHASDDIPKE